MGGVLSALRGLQAASPEPTSPHHSVVQRDQSEPAVQESAHICQHSLPRTDLYRYLSNNDTDHPSGLPIGLCSLALRYFLPECELERYLYRLTTEAEESTGFIDECSSQVRKLFTGSSSEGLGVPMFCSRTLAGGGETMCDAPLTIPTPDTPPGEQGDGPVVTTSDKDCMFELGQFPVAPERGEARLYMDARSASHRGYVHVLLDPDWSPSPGVETSRIPSDQLLRPLPVKDGAAPEQRLCLSSDALMKVWHDNNQFSGTVERHGPAINSIQLLHGMPVDFDSVPALRLTRPPQQLLDWLKRIDECGARWPPEEVRESIRSGTEATAHLVATGHASSARRDLEWRLSFSVAEKRLARTLSITQRKAYLLMKLVQKCFLARPKVLVTYHLKTMMFWELETTQHCWSEEHLFGRVLGLLDRIDACLSERRIPSYFFPENNLISDCSAEDVAAVRRALGLVRGDLLRSLFAIDAAVRFEFSTATPLVTFHEPFLSAIAAGATAPSIAEVAATAASGLIRQARDGLPRNKHTLARSSELLRDALQLRSAAGAAAAREDDWLMMTAAALCAANHRDEDVWVRDVLWKRVVSAEDVPPLTERHVQLWEAVCPSGLPPGQESPLLALIGSCLDSYGDLIDRRAIQELFDDFIGSDKPRLPSESLTTLMIAEETIEEVIDHPQPVNVPGQVNMTEHSTEGDDSLYSMVAAKTSSNRSQNEAWQRNEVNGLCSVLQSLVMDTFELNKSSMEIITRKLVEAGLPKSLVLQAPSRFGADLCSMTLAGWDEFGSGSVVGSGRGDQLICKFELIDFLESGKEMLLDIDAYMEDHVNNTTTALLDTLCCLLLKGHYKLANRAATWLKELSVTLSEHATKEDRGRITYNLRRSSRFLACLPEAIRSLLLLSPCEISLPALDVLFMYAAPLLEAAAEEHETSGSPSPEERVMDVLVTWEEVVCEVGLQPLSDAARLSDAVLKLCLVRLAGGTERQCAECLTEAEDQIGGEATVSVRRALAEVSSVNG